MVYLSQALRLLKSAGARSPKLSDALLLDAIRQGWITPPPISVEREPPSRKPMMTIVELLPDLQHDRADRTLRKSLAERVQRGKISLIERNRQMTKFHLKMLAEEQCRRSGESSGQCAGHRRSHAVATVKF